MKAEGFSRLTYVLEQQGDMVKLTLTHEAPAPKSKFLDAVSDGWPRHSREPQEPARNRRVARGDAQVAGRNAMTESPEFKPKTVYVTYIAATPEKVWQALTDPAFTRQYFAGFNVDVEPRTGGAFFLRYPDGRVHISGKVVEWSPPQRFPAHGSLKA